MRLQTPRADPRPSSPPEKDPQQPSFGILSSPLLLNSKHTFFLPPQEYAPCPSVACPHPLLGSPELGNLLRPLRDPLSLRSPVTSTPSAPIPCLHVHPPRCSCFRLIGPTVYATPPPGCRMGISHFTWFKTALPTLTCSSTAWMPQSQQLHLKHFSAGVHPEELKQVFRNTCTSMFIAAFIQ